jgi:subtilase family serine protease
VRAFTAAFGTMALAALGLASVAATTASASTSATHGAGIYLKPGVIRAVHSLKQAPTTAECEADFSVACYSPLQIEQAYGLPALYKRGIEGQGQTIVIVDSFGSPTIAGDLAVFDKTYGLPAPPSLKVIQPAGPVTWTGSADQEGWAGETTLDVEYAHTVAPKAKILLVETPVSETEGTTGFPQIVTAEKYVIDHNLGDVISQSFSATEQTFPSKGSIESLRGAYLDAYRHNVTVLAASGDSGAADAQLNGSDLYTFPVTSWPDSDPLVTGVGGTQLHLNAAGDKTGPDSAWNDTYSVATNQFIFGDNGPNPLASGGGKSVIFNRPSYQDGVRRTVGDQRGVPDISMSGACNGAVNVYESLPGVAGSWGEVCGASESTPLFSGIVALADQVAHHRLGLINPTLYRLSAEHAPGVVPVTSGNNTVSFAQNGTTYTVQGYAAKAGYSLVDGVGTVYAPAFVYELASRGF